MILEVKRGLVVDNHAGVTTEVQAIGQPVLMGFVNVGIPLVGEMFAIDSANNALAVATELSLLTEGNAKPRGRTCRSPLASQQP